jgi:predicted DNA-binding transcriptional regulator AlpA
MKHDGSKYLTRPQVQKRYHRTRMTIYRWENDPNMGFPKPIVINGRTYHEETQLDDFDRSRLKGGSE